PSRNSTGKGTEHVGADRTCPYNANFSLRRDPVRELPVSSEGSVTHWLRQLQAGDSDAVQQLWERYFPRLVGLARIKLRDNPRQTADEEHVALSAFASFCLNPERGRFPNLHDRDGLWALLVVITARKAGRLLRDSRRKKRGGGVETVGESAPGP